MRRVSQECPTANLWLLLIPHQLEHFLAAAGVLAERLGVPASSMSFHLAQLANAGLVSQRRESRSIIYSADYAAMNRLMGYLTENCCGGVPCADDAACLPQDEKRTA